ncbi:MAG TPA: hypothetical protein VMX16_11420 [Terriglobia bacterium]|nr:hypothetical protein [Terriglobia bacterium]
MANQCVRNTGFCVADSGLARTLVSGVGNFPKGQVCGGKSLSLREITDATTRASAPPAY